MNLVVPVNLQALRVTPNDASLITKRSDFFSGPTSSFEELPWRDPAYTEHPGRISKANLSANVANPLSGSVAEQLEAGIHLHWALPDGLTRGVQQPDGTLAFPPVPNRWLVTRILQRSGEVSSRQWLVESDYLMTEAEYTGNYYPATRRKAVSVPVGWALAEGNDPQRDGGALYYPPSRRMGKVFELGAWQPTTSPPGTPPDQVRHLDELERRAHAFAQGSPPGALKAVGPSGPAFAAFYPDSRSAFGFHDRLEDLGADLGSAAFQVSYQVVGWHSHASDDPLQSPRLAQALAKANADNANAPAPRRVDAARVAADTVRETYRWSYDPAAGTPSRCVYSGQLAGLRWDTTGALPGDPRYPQCYLQPLGDDPTVRLAVGSSSSSAMAALVKHEWAEWAGTGWSPDAGQASEIGERIERDLEFLIDALQLGLLHQLGTSNYLPQLEQALHRAEFGSLQGGQLWTIGSRASAADPANPGRFNPPEPQLPRDGSDLAGKLATLNACQTRLDALLGTADSCRRQIFSDWYHYIGAVGSGDADPGANALKEELKGYISRQVLDLWAKLDAAFGTKAAPSAATANLPVFHSGAADYLALQGGRYTSASPLPTLAGQIADAANAILAVLLGTGYENFELRRVERPRFWQPNEPVVVATGEGLRPAQRNGTARYLPCRVSGQLVKTLEATAGGSRATVAAADAAASAALAVPDLAANATPESADTRPLLDHVRALRGEACLLDASLAPLLADKLGAIGGGAVAADLRAALGDVAEQISRAWRAGAPEGAPLSIPAVLTGLSATSGTLQLSLPGQAPQGAGLTAQPGDTWEDPFLPLFLVWKVSYRAPQKGAAAGAQRYDPGFVTSRFQLDENTIDLVPSGGAAPTEAGSATLSGSIPLSSRAADPLLDQIRQYLQEHPAENPQLQAVIEHLRDKPLLSQGLSGINPALLSRAEGMQLTVFNPFYDAEPPATELGAGTDTLSYANVLTHFVGWAAGALADQVPLGEAGFNPLRTGYLDVVSAEVVDVFGRKRRVVDSGAAADANKVVVAQQLRPPAGATAQIGLPPRLAQPARLLLEWVSGNDGRLVTNSHPATSPVAGWVVSNYLDYSLMLFAPSGQPLGSLGVFGAKSSVAWQSAPGNPARPMATDLGAPGLEHFLKFATFIHGRPRGFFDALMASIENAHTYILSDGAGGDQPYAVLMGRPLALVRAELRLELAGLPAFDSGL
ncbi:MAG TPA: hypothetical protein VF613_23975, partial [Longimicrobium sp.]